MEELLVGLAGFVGGFVSTLTSNGSSLTLPALEFLGLPDHVANGTNRLSVVALGLVGTISFSRRGLIDWRKGPRIVGVIALGTFAGALVAVDMSDTLLDVIVVSGLLFVLGLLLARPGHWLEGKGGTLKPFGWGQAAAYFAIGIYAGLVVLGSGFFMLAALVMFTGYDLRHGNAMKSFILLVVGLESLLIFEDRGEVEWSAGIPLALGSGVGTYVATLVASQQWAKVWVYRLLVAGVILSIVQLVMADPGRILQLV